MRTILENYRKAEVALRLARSARFPSGAAVKVDAEKYEGNGIVVPDSLCPLTQVPVRVPNGNVWYYDITDCEPLE